MDEQKKKKIEKYLTVPNIITSLRIIGAVVLLFLEIRTWPFYIIYGVCGVSDAVDGFIARRMHATSSFGRKLDSISDLVFYAAMAYKMLMPLIETLHPVVSYTVLGLLIIRLGVYLISAFRFKIFLSSHSLLNKGTGLIVFLIPYFIDLDPFFFYYSILGCVVAAAAITYDILNFKRAYDKRKEEISSES